MKIMSRSWPSPSGLSGDVEPRGTASAADREDAGHWTLDELVADTVAAIDFLGRRHGGGVCLFGNSLGAMIAILTGARDERVIDVVAANTPARATEQARRDPQRVTVRYRQVFVTPVFESATTCCR
jgi:alpha-beta hydrolase superfamily lysophospholipase